MKHHKKKLQSIIISILLISSFMLAGCSAASGNSKTLKGEVNFKEALSNKSSRVWFVTNGLDGRNTHITAAVIIEDGKAAAYIPNVNSEETLGTLEDYYSLSDAEAIDLVKERYEKIYRSYYEGLNAILEEEQQMLDDSKKNAAEAEGTYFGMLDEMNASQVEYFTKQVQAITDTYNTLKETAIEERQPEEISFAIYADSTGNQTEAEELRTKVTYPATYDGEMALGSDNIFHVVDAKTEDFIFYAVSGCTPIEVYDTYYGGFGRGDYQLITKCDADTTFELDPVGTKGIEKGN